MRLIESQQQKDILFNQSYQFLRTNQHNTIKAIYVQYDTNPIYNQSLPSPVFTTNQIGAGLDI